MVVRHRPDQHPVASYYRNTIIHFFVNKAIVELALLKCSETEGSAALDVFWEEVDKLRDLFVFEFFYAPPRSFTARFATSCGATMKTGRNCCNRVPGFRPVAEQHAAAGRPRHPADLRGSLFNNS